MPTLEVPPEPPALVQKCKKPVCSPLGLALQLLPNLAIGIDRDRAAIGGRLRLTPVLLSVGMVGAPRWRSLAVEALERNAGSVELVLQGELYHRARGRGVVRALLVGTFPLLERGEQLSMSLGVGVASELTSVAASAEIGLYTMGGTLGINLAISPLRLGPLATLTIVLKLF